MPTVLTIATADVRRLAGIDAGDTSQDTAIAALVTAEQPVHEWALDPGILALAVALLAPVPPAVIGLPANPGLLATLTLGACEVMAGDYLQTTARAGSLSGFQVSGLHLVIPAAQTPGALGAALTKQGLARLSPFTRAARSVSAAAAGVAPDDYAPIPQLIGAFTPEPSVFDRPFADIGDNPDSPDATAPWDWGVPEP